MIGTIPQMKTMIRRVLLTLIPLMLVGCVESKPIAYETVYSAENDITVTMYTIETKDEIVVESMVLVITESTAYFASDQIDGQEAVLALNAYYQETIATLSSMPGVAFSLTDKYLESPDQEQFLAVSLLPTTFELGANWESYPLILHLNFALTPSPEVRAYLKATLGIDTELTSKGLNLNMFLRNSAFKFHYVLNEQYRLSKVKQ